MAFVGYGQNDSGGQALPAVADLGITFATSQGFPTGISFVVALRGPQNAGILYQQSGSVFTGGKGQIFPTGRS